MKQTIDSGIGGRCFTLDEDAHKRLECYLDTFSSMLDPSQKGEVMDEIENRIADILQEKVSDRNQVVNIETVESIINQLGFPDGSAESDKQNQKEENKMEGTRKLYRNPDDKKIAGVCGGISAFFNLDVTIIRVIFLVALLCASAGFWIYLAIWIVASYANTPVQKCEMYGLPVTAENIARFTKN